MKERVRFVIPAQAGIQTGELDSRLRGNDVRAGIPAGAGMTRNLSF